LVNPEEMTRWIVTVPDKISNGGCAKFVGMVEKKAVPFPAPLPN